MTTTSVTVRMDKQLKEKAEILFAELGMNMTTAFTVFAKTAVRQGRIPFEITLDPFYSQTNQSHLKRAIERMERTGGTVHDLTDATRENCADDQIMG